MDPQLKNILLTVALVVIVFALFLWLLRSLLTKTKPTSKEYARDRLEIAGYETIGSTQRKEYSVAGLSTLIILLCLGIIGYFGYMLFSGGIMDMVERVRLLNLILVFIPAIVFLTLIIVTSMSYLKHQLITLDEFRDFKSNRDKAIMEYQAKRSGKLEKKEEKRSIKQMRAEGRRKKAEEVERAKKRRRKTARH